MNKIIFLFFILSLLILSACSPGLVGDDLDEYGCKASAGYQYCNITGKCQRDCEEPCIEELVNASAENVTQNVSVENLTQNVSVENVSIENTSAER